MLVCPECEFENPLENKFCQRCGSSLTTKECESCGATVSFQDVVCAECGAPTATILLGLLFPTGDKSPLMESLYSSPEPPMQEETPTPEKTQSPPKKRGGTTTLQGDSLPTETDLSPDPSETDPSEMMETEETLDPSLDPNDATLNELSLVLDAQKRYRIFPEFLPPEEATETPPLELKIWDSQPLQKTYLEQLVATPERKREVIEELPKRSPVSNIEFWRDLGVGTMAIPYLVLQESLFPAIPVLYDTWKTDQETFVLLEDRSDWELLGDLWEDDKTPAIQLLYWLNEMAKLWQELEMVGCCQSLLVEANLRVDEDQSLCLEQIIIDPGPPPPLSKLGEMWNVLFSRAQRTIYGPLGELLQNLSAGIMTSVQEVRSQLHEIANHQETGGNGEIPGSATMETAEDPDKMVYRSMAEDQPTVVLPMQLLSIADAGMTDIGVQRDHNEDHFGIETRIVKQENALGKTLQVQGLYIVCDGMGGHAAGEVASAMAVETLQLYFKAHWLDKNQLPDEKTILEAIALANEKIYHVNLDNSRSGSGRMGTTLVMLLVQDTNIAIAHVGDSRIYRVTRKSGIEQLTTDHEVGQREIMRGVDPEDAYARPDAYQLTQALGPRDNDFVRPDIQYLELNEDTLILLCSDGLSDGDLLENHYDTYLTPMISSRANLEQKLVELIDFANEHNGHDNITGVVARIKMRPNTDQLF